MKTIQPQTLLPATFLKLSAIVEGTEPISVKWYRNGQQLQSGRGYNISFLNMTAELERDSVTPDYSGEYLCEVSNAAGMETCKADVFVKGLFVYFMKTC